MNPSVPSVPSGSGNCSLVPGSIGSRTIGAEPLREPQNAAINAATAADPWLTLAQSAAETQTCERTLRYEICRGRLRHARVGGRRSIRIRRSWLNAWLEQSATPIEVRR